MARCCVVVFAKLPRPGRVKTRLTADLSAARAAELAAAFVADLERRLGGQSFGLRFAWALEPGDPPPAPAAWVQRGVDLGDRMANAFAAAFAEHDQVAIVGADLPDLEPAACRDAFAALDRGADVVLGPATDGGYYLIALAAGAVPAALFTGIPWGTGEVLDLTRARCSRLGLELALLPAAEDVDTPDDLARLAARLAAAPDRCPTTYGLLAAWGRLPLPAAP